MKNSVLKVIFKITRDNINKEREKFGEDKLSFESMFRKLFDSIINAGDKSTVSKYLAGKIPASFFAEKDRETVQTQLYINLKKICSDISATNPKRIAEMNNKIYDAITQDSKTVDETNNLKNLRDDSSVDEYYNSIAIAYLIAIYACDSRHKGFQPKLDAYFVGRDKELNKMYSALNENRCVIVYGLDGYGKTSLCLQFLALYSDIYINIKRGQFISSLDKTLKKIGFEESDDKAGTVVYIENFWIGTSGFESYNISSYIEKYEKACFIFESSMNFGENHNQSTCAASVMVGALPPDELTKILSSRIKDDNTKIQLQNNAQFITNSIAGHTLIAELIYKLLNNHKLSFNEMMSEIENGRSFEKGKIYRDKSGVNTKKTINAHIDDLYLLDLLQDNHRKILWLLSLMPDWHYINRILLEKWFPDAGDIEDLVKMGYVIKAEKDGDISYTMHPIIKDRARRTNNIINIGIDDVLENIQDYVSGNSLYCGMGTAWTLYWICLNNRNLSSKWIDTKSRILLCLSDSGKGFILSGLIKNDEKSSLSPEVLYRAYGDRYPDKDKVEAYNNEIIDYYNILLQAEENSDYLRDWINKNLLKKPEFDDRLIHDLLHHLSNVLAFRSYKYQNSYAKVFIRMLEWYKTARNIDESVDKNDIKDFIGFLKQELDCKTCEETVIFRKVIENSPELLRPHSFFSSKLIMDEEFRDIYFIILFYKYTDASDSIRFEDLLSYYNRISGKIIPENRLFWLNSLCYLVLEHENDLSSYYDIFSMHSNTLLKVLPQNDLVIYWHGIICKYYYTALLQHMNGISSDNVSSVFDTITQEYYNIRAYMKNCKNIDTTTININLILLCRDYTGLLRIISKYISSVINHETVNKILDITDQSIASAFNIFYTDEDRDIKIAAGLVGVNGLIKSINRSLFT